MLKKRKGLKIDLYEKDEKIPRAELLKRVKGIDILLSILTDKIDAKVMDAAGPHLKMIANYAVGFDNIDLAAAKKRGIVVTNAPGNEISETVAEHAVALIFGLAHRIVEADEFLRAGKYKAWGPQLLLGTDVGLKTLGIIGTGNIGTALIHRMHDGFGLKIIYHDLKRNREIEKQYKATYRTKEQLLKEADFISLHVPLIPATHHLISTKELKMMKKTAFLINTSRGPVIDEKALVVALKKGTIAGAGLDVYEHEPKLTAGLKGLKNTILTPHTASATIEARQALSRTAAANILAFLDGKQPPNRINK